VAKPEIIEKIKKLLQLADASKNSNIEEAASAAAKAQALMEKHRIKKAMLNESDQINTRLLVDKGAPADWKLFLITALCSLNGCYVVRSENYQTDNQVFVVGEELDFETVQQLYSYLVMELNKLCILELLEIKTETGVYPSLDYAQSFYMGGVTAIRSRLEIAKQESRREEFDNAVSMDYRQKLTRALVRLDSKLAKAKAWVENNISVEFKSVTTTSKDAAGYQAGVEAANQINLTPDRKSIQ